MDQIEIERLREAVLFDIGAMLGEGAATIRAVDAGGELLIIANVPDRSAREAVLQIVQRRFIGAAIRVEP